MKRKFHLARMSYIQWPASDPKAVTEPMLVMHAYAASNCKPHDLVLRNVHAQVGRPHWKPSSS